MFMSFGGADVTGKLRESVEERILTSSLSGVEDKRIVIESVAVTYRLENRPAVRGCSENVRVLPNGGTPGVEEPPEIHAKHFDDWAV